MLRHLFLTFERPAEKEWLPLRIHDLSSTLYHNQLWSRESKSGIKRIPNARRTYIMVLSSSTVDHFSHRNGITKPYCRSSVELLVMGNLQHHSSIDQLGVDLLDPPTKTKLFSSKTHRGTVEPTRTALSASAELLRLTLAIWLLWLCFETIDCSCTMQSISCMEGTNCRRVLQRQGEQNMSVCLPLRSFFMECSILHVHYMIATTVLINQIISSTQLSIDRLHILQGISDWQGLLEMHRHGSWETAGRDAGVALLQLRQRIKQTMTTK